MTANEPFRSAPRQISIPPSSLSKMQINSVLKVAVGVLPSSSADRWVAMGNNNPVGVFDSGVGGLSVFRRIRADLPHESLLYVADSGHAPYGNKPAEFIARRAVAITEFLLEQNAKAALKLAHRGYVLEVGRIILQGEARELLTNPEVRNAYLGGA